MKNLFSATTSTSAEPGTHGAPVAEPSVEKGHSEAGEAKSVEAGKNGGPNTATPQPAGSEDLSDRDIKRSLKAYFSREYDETWRRHLAEEATTRFTRWMIALIGAALFAAPFIKVILTAETDRQIIGQEEGQLFLLPGFLLLLIAVISPLWQKGWVLPMALSIAVAALDLYVFQVGHVAIIYALLAVSAAVLLWDARSFLEERRKPKSVKEFEEKVDDWTERQLRRLIELARNDLPIADGRLTADSVVLLKSFPKVDRLDKAKVQARIGTDGIPRMSPIGLAAFDFGADDVVMFEGAVDLNTGEAVYMRLHQFRYDGISAVNWSTDVWPPEPVGSSGKQGDREPVVSAGHKRAIQRRDELQIRLKGAHDIRLVFRDGSLAERLENKAFKRIEKMDRIKAVFQKLAIAAQ